MSDQDFFFDEEDEKPAKAASKPAAKAAPKPAAKKPSAAKAAPPAPVPFFDQSVTMSVAALLVACGLLVGVIGGVLIGEARAANGVVLPDSTAATSGTGAAAGAGGTGAAAPQLTPDQMNSGQLPAGHPSIGGAAGATGKTAPSKAATSGK